MPVEKNSGRTSTQHRADRPLRPGPCTGAGSPRRRRERARAGRRRPSWKEDASGAGGCGAHEGYRPESPPQARPRTVPAPAMTGLATVLRSTERSRGMLWSEEMESSATRRVLIVAHRTAASPPLIDAVRVRALEGPFEPVLLVPASPHGFHRAVDPEDKVAQRLRRSSRSPYPSSRRRQDGQSRPASGITIRSRPSRMLSTPSASMRSSSPPFRGGCRAGSISIFRARSRVSACQ
jgi:hypothetical protein